MNNWIKDYFEGLNYGNRFETMKKALELLKKRESHIIVETGTIRQENDWGAGMSTLIFAEYCKRNQAHLFTVDIDPKAIKTCKSVTSKFANVITYIVNDSVEFLKIFNQKIDLLYLDSMDCPEYDAPTSPNLILAQEWQLNELKTAFDKLSDNPIILLDDNSWTNGGKTKLSKEFLKEKGFKNILEGKQSLWILEDKNG